MKRLFDILLSSAGLVILSPILVVVLFLVWLQDYRNPFYSGDRIGLNGVRFKMIKIRSMVTGADRVGVESTSANDARITAVGHFVRKWKLDELTQLWNVLRGDMSLVGPRPNTERGVSVYTQAERRLLTVRPGITDFSSIVFSDEGAILLNSTAPDEDYNRLIRPWKSRLGLLYVDSKSLALDFKLIWLTVIGIIDKSVALSGVAKILQDLGAEAELVKVAQRDSPLEAHVRSAPE